MLVSGTLPWKMSLHHGSQRTPHRLHASPPRLDFSIHYIVFYPFRAQTQFWLLLMLAKPSLYHTQPYLYAKKENLQR